MGLSSERAKYYGSLGRGVPKSHTLDAIESKRWFIEQVHKNLKPIFEALYNKAIQGDIMAIKELLDRSWGKAVQGVEVSGKDGNPIVFMPLELIQKHALEIAPQKAIDVNSDVKKIV